MKRQRFSEEQIIRILHEAESLDNVCEVCRQHNIAEQTLYRWRRQLGAWRSLRPSVSRLWSRRTRH
jgi:putative transposase